MASSRRIVLRLLITEGDIYNTHLPGLASRSVYTNREMATPNNTGAGDPGHGIVIRRFNPAPDSWDEVAVSRIVRSCFSLQLYQSPISKFYASKNPMASHIPSTFLIMLWELYCHILPSHSMYISIFAVQVLSFIYFPLLSIHPNPLRPN